MKSCFFILITTIAIADTAMFGMRFGTAILIFVILKIQADSAATAFIKLEMKKFLHNEPVNTPMDYFAEIKIPRNLPNLVLKEEKAEISLKPIIVKTSFKIVPPFKAPKFTGQPHEVLGIEADASGSTIQKAFRYWIKLYHPDHFRSSSARQEACEKTRKITEAKMRMLAHAEKNRAA